MADANTKKYFLNAVKMQTVLTFWTCGHTNFVAICHDLATGMKKVSTFSF